MEPKYTFHYEAEANSSFLVAVLENSGDLIQYQMRMLENNAVSHLLNTRKYQQDDSVRICYNVTSRLSLAQVLARQKMQQEEFLTLLSGLAESYLELPEYQLFGRGLLLDEEYIFVKTGSFEPSFVYLPIYTEDDGLESFRRFVQKLVLESRVASTSDNFLQWLLDLTNDRGLTAERLAEEVEKRRHAVRKPAAQPVRQPEPPVFSAAPQEPRPAPTPAPAPAPSPAPSPAPASAPAGNRTGKKKAGKKEKPAKPEKSGKKDASNGSVLFTALQGVLVILIALAAKSGFFLQEGGGLNVSYIAGVLILAAGIDVVVYRELFVNRKKEKGKVPAKKASSRKNARSAPASAEKPAGVSPAAPAPMPAAPAPAATPAVPVSYAPPVYAPSPAPAAPQPGEEDTVVIEPESFGQGCLEYFENGLAMRIHLDRDVTRVGSRAQSVDHVLASPKVSKIHAEFVRRDGRYFVRDLNSTNGTYLNDVRQRIVSNQETELHNGDRVRLADIELTFKC